MNPSVRLHLAYAGMGATAGVIPAVLPAVIQVHGDGALLAPPLVFVGVLCGVIGAAVSASRAHANGLLAAGCALQALGVLCAALAWSAEMFTLGALIAGLGFGLAESAGSIVAKQMSDGGLTGRLSALTATVAATATVTPLIVLAMTSVGLPLFPLFLSAALNLVAAGPLLFLPSRRVSDPSAAEECRPRKLLFAAGAAIMLYVGVESVIAGWSATIPYLLVPAALPFAALGTSAFWLLMSFGRGLAAALLRKGTEPWRLMRIASASASLLLLAAAVTVDRWPTASLVALGLCVISFAPMYGLLLGTALERVPVSMTAYSATVLVAAGALGGALLPLGVVWLGLSPASTATLGTLCAGTAILWIIVRAARPSPVARR